MSHKNRQNRYEPSTAGPTPQYPTPRNPVTMYGVALIDDMFVPVKATVDAADTEPLGAAMVYMEFAYDTVQSAVEDESLKRASHRYGVKS